MYSEGLHSRMSLSRLTSQYPAHASHVVVLESPAWYAAKLEFLRVEILECFVSQQVLRLLYDEVYRHKYALILALYCDHSYPA